MKTTVKFLKISLLLLLFFLHSYCAPKFFKSAEVTHLSIGADVKQDPDFYQFVLPFKEKLEAEMNTVIGKSDAAIIKSGPGETALGNLVADYQKEFAEATLGYSVDISIINNGGIRNNLPSGPITLGNIYELSPFDNYLHVLELKAEDVVTLAEFAAERKILGIAGMHIATQGNEIITLQVGNRDLEKNRTYFLAVNDYLANGGDNMEFLTTLPRIEETNFLLRDILIQQIKIRTNNSEKISAQVEGRQKYN